MVSEARPVPACRRGENTRQALRLLWSGLALAVVVAVSLGFRFAVSIAGRAIGFV